jgi:hypothetical protein
MDCDMHGRVHAEQITPPKGIQRNYSAEFDYLCTRSPWPWDPLMVSQRDESSRQVTEQGECLNQISASAVNACDLNIPFCLVALWTSFMYDTGRDEKVVTGFPMMSLVAALSASDDSPDASLDKRFMCARSNMAKSCCRAK